MIIYKITNIITNKIYIGQTIHDIDHRRDRHLAAMRSGSKSHLHNSIRKHGWDNFTMEVIDTAVSQEELDKKEAYYIKKLNSIEEGYNLLEGATHNPMYVEEIAAKHKKTMQSEEVRKAISETMKRHRREKGFSEDTRRKLSEAKKRNYREGVMPKSYIDPKHRELAHEANKKKVRFEHVDGTVMEFDQMKDGAKWWRETYNLPLTHKTVMSVIKKSDTNDKYYHDAKWTYL